MGTWKIEVRGHGGHHNRRTDDADAMARVFIEWLRTGGHEVNTATFTLTHPSGEEVQGSAEDLLQGATGGLVTYPNGPGAPAEPYAG